MTWEYRPVVATTYFARRKSFRLGPQISQTGANHIQFTVRQHCGKLHITIVIIIDPIRPMLPVSLLADQYSASTAVTYQQQQRQNYSSSTTVTSYSVSVIGYSIDRRRRFRQDRDRTLASRECVPHPEIILPNVEITYFSIGNVDLVCTLFNIQWNFDYRQMFRYVWRVYGRLHSWLDLASRLTANLA